MDDRIELHETERARARRSEWRRDEEGRKIAGVCAGLAEAFGVSVTLVRAGFVMAALPPFSGTGVVLYLVLWFLMPAEDGVSGLDRLTEMVSKLVSDPPRRPRRRAARESDELY